MTRPGRHLFSAVTVLTLLIASLLLAPRPALAATGADECSIIDTSPERVVIGIAAKRVTFDVGTDCDDDEHNMQWYVGGENYPGSVHVQWFAACTYAYAGPSSPDCTHHGSTVINPLGDPEGSFQGNKMAGQQPLYAYAFDDVDDDGFDNDYDCVEDTEAEECQEAAHTWLTSSITLLRRTTWGTSLNATPEPVRKGKSITITGQVQRANWDTATYQKFGAYVTLQFKPESSDTYRDVKTVWDDGAKARTTVKATRSGTFRYFYAGDSTHAASYSKGDFVKVRPALRAPARRTVTPGAFCKKAEAGDIGYSGGKTYRCSFYPSSERYRWKRV